MLSQSKMNLLKSVCVCFLLFNTCEQNVILHQSCDYMFLGGQICVSSQMLYLLDTTNCFKNMIEEYFMIDCDPVVFLITKSRMEEAYVKFYVEYFTHPYMIFKRNNHLLDDNYVGTKYVLSVSNKQSFKRVLHFLSYFNTMWGSKVKLLIFLLTNNEKDTQVLFEEVIEILKLENVNAVILCINKIYVFKSTFSEVFYNWDIICQNINITFKANKPLTSYTAACVDYKPRFLRTLQLSNRNDDVECKVMNIIASKLNFSFEYINENSVYDGGDVYENGTTFGNFKLLESKVNVISGGYQPLYARYKRFNQIFPHMFITTNWLVPYELIQTNLDYLSNMMDKGTLFLILGILILTTIVKICISKQINKSYAIGKTILHIYATFLGIATHLPENTVLRLTMILIIFINLFLNSMLSTSLTSRLADIEYRQKFNTEERILKSQLDVYAHPVHRAFFKNTEYFSRIHTVIDIYDCIHKLAEGQLVACAVSKLFNNYITGHYLNEDNTPLIYDSNVHLISHPLTIYTRRGFPYSDNMSDITLKMLEAGFSQKFTVDQDMIALSEDYKTHFLRFKHLEPIFIVILGAHGCSLVVFLLELIVFKLLKCF